MDFRIRRKRWERFATAAFALRAGFVRAEGQDFRKQVICQIVTDRFFNGDTGNDNPPQSAGLFDPTKKNWHLCWGSDLAGIRHKLPYLKGYGYHRHLDFAAGG